MQTKVRQESGLWQRQDCSVLMSILPFSPPYTKPQEDHWFWLSEGKHDHMGQQKYLVSTLGHFSLCQCHLELNSWLSSDVLGERKSVPYRHRHLLRSVLSAGPLPLRSRWLQSLLAGFPVSNFFQLQTHSMVSHKHPCLGTYSDSLVTLCPSPKPLARLLKHPAQPSLLSPLCRATLVFPAWLLCVLTCVFPNPKPHTTPPKSAPTHP